MIQNFSVAYNYFYLGIEKLNNLSQFFFLNKNSTFFSKYNPLCNYYPLNLATPNLISGRKNSYF